MEAKTKVFGQHDEATIKQIERCVAAGGDRGVLCADGHKGYAQPIGGIVAYKDKISLSGVGFDIACGNLAIRTDAKRNEIAPKIDKFMDDVVHEIPFVSNHALVAVPKPDHSTILVRHAFCFRDRL